MGCPSLITPLHWTGANCGLPVCSSLSCGKFDLFSLLLFQLTFYRPELNCTFPTDQTMVWIFLLFQKGRNAFSHSYFISIVSVSLRWFFLGRAMLHNVEKPGSGVRTQRMRGTGCMLGVFVQAQWSPGISSWLAGVHGPRGSRTWWHLIFSFQLSNCPGVLSATRPLDTCSVVGLWDCGMILILIFFEN